jgi:hypothetical protein
MKIKFILIAVLFSLASQRDIKSFGFIAAGAAVGTGYGVYKSKFVNDTITHFFTKPAISNTLGKANSSVNSVNLGDLNGARNTVASFLNSKKVSNIAIGAVAVASAYVVYKIVDWAISKKNKN